MSFTGNVVRKTAAAVALAVAGVVAVPMMATAAPGSPAPVQATVNGPSVIGTSNTSMICRTGYKLAGPWYAKYYYSVNRVEYLGKPGRYHRFRSVWSTGYTGFEGAGKGTYTSLCEAWVRDFNKSWFVRHLS